MLPKVIEKFMRKMWDVQEAQAKLTKLINDVQRNGPFTITRNGQPVAMMISAEEFKKLKPKNTLIEFFRAAPCPEIDLF